MGLPGEPVEVLEEVVGEGVLGAVLAEAVLLVEVEVLAVLEWPRRRLEVGRG